MDKQEFLKLLGNNIVRLRKQKNWSQADLARACDKEPQSIERIENSKSNPTAYYLKEIAEALEVPIARLFEF